MKTKLIYPATLLFLLLLTGTFWGTWFTLTRSINEFSAAEFIHIGRVIISNVALAMPFIVTASLLLILLSLWIGRKKSGFAYGVVSLICFVAVLLITLIAMVPIDNLIKTWTVENIPSNWEDFRDKWAIWHIVRSFTSVAGFILYSIFIMTESSFVRRKYRLEKRNKGFWI